MSSTQEKRADYHPDETELDQPRPRTPHPLPESIGPYHIIEVIGEGGMGIVYKAEQRDPVRRVAAIKVIKLGMDTKEIVARFDTERQALALMSHPNVAKVFEAGMTDQGRPYFAMEFVPGVAITHYCDTQKLTTRERLELFIPVCQAVQHAHQKGIIHRDLKPGNILITLFDGKPVPKVIDFGVAKATSIQLTDKTLFTQTGTVIGTLEYMSPEQATSSGLDVDTRTDVYSLGVILYQLLTGSLPFEPDTLRKASRERAIQIIQNSDPPKPSQRMTLSTRAANEAPVAPDATEIARRHHTDLHTLRRELRGDLDWIVLKAMEKDRTRRYESASALATDLQRHFADEPVLARPPSTAYKLRKFVRRHRVVVTAAAVVFLTILGGAAATGYGLFQKSIANVERSLRATKEQEAQNAINTASRVSGLFQEVLLPITSDGIRRTPAQVLDDATRRLEGGALAGDPAIEANTHEVLGRRFVAIGLYQRAIPRFRVALALNTRLRGADSPELVSGLNELANALVINGDLAEAEKPLADAMAIESKSGHANDTARASTLDLQGALLAGRGDLAAAEPLLQQALQIRQKVSGDSRDLADSLAHLGDLHRQMDKPDGQALLDRARQMYARVFELQPLGMIGPMREMARNAANRRDWSDWATVDRTFDQRNLFAVPQDLRLLGDWINSFTMQLHSGPTNRDLLIRRGGSYARRGEFEIAAADYAKALEMDSSRFRLWYWCLPLYLQNGQVEQYRQMRHKALTQFKTPQDAQTAHMIAKSTLCYPFISSDTDDLTSATSMAENAIRMSLRPGDQFNRQNLNPRAWQGINPFFIQSMGMAEYREGRFSSAIFFMNLSRDHVYVYRDAMADFYIAMAAAKNGDREQAHSLLAAGSHLWATSAPKPTVDDLEQFEDWILCDQARLEASNLIHDK